MADIKRNLVFLSQNITNLPGILTYLVQEDVISESEREYIKTRNTFMERNGELLLLMLRKDWQKNRKLFLKVLRGTNNGHCADKIEETNKSESKKRRITDELGQSLGDIKVPKLHNNFEEDTKPKEMFQQISFRVTTPHRFYTGREEEVKLLEEYWNDCMTQKTLSITAVTGVGGVGKTELAKNFAKWFYETVGGHCIWINAETPQSLVESFKTLAQQNLEISLNDDLGKEKKFLEIVEETYDKLFGQKTFLVFDNLENYELPVLKLLIDLSSKKPPTVLKPFVVTISRHCEAKQSSGPESKILQLQVFTKESALQFFYKSFNLDEPPGVRTNELIDILCQRLQFFPLAMRQATAYINESLPFCCCLQEAIILYLDEMEKHSKDLLNCKLTQYEAMDDNSKTIFLTWRIAVDKLREKSDEVAVDILNVFSFLSPDSIPTEFVKTVLQKMNKISNLGNVDAVFDLIQKYSMIEYSGHKLISVHRLVQEVTRIHLQEKGEFRVFLNEIATSINNMLEEGNSCTELIQFQMLWYHLSKNKEMIEVHGRLPWWISSKLYQSGKYRDLLLFSNETVNILESALGQNNKWTLEMKHWKGSALTALGDFSESIEILENICEKQRDMLGDQDKVYLETSVQVGYAYLQLKKYEDALKIFKIVLEKKEEIFGQKHPETISVKNNIAYVLAEQKKFGEAIKVYEGVLEVEERLLGVEHPSALSTKHNIATLKLYHKDFQEALKEFQEVLEVQERILGVNHPNTLKTRHNIAVAYCHLGLRDESLQLLKQVYQTQMRILGPRHPHTINTLAEILLRSLVDTK